jgi:hypothetical protein
MNNKFKRSLSNSGYYPGIFVEGLRKTTQDLSSVRIELGPLEYDTQMLTTQLRHSVIMNKCYARSKDRNVNEGAEYISLLQLSTAVVILSL